MFLVRHTPQIQLGVIGVSAILIGVSNTKGDAVGFPNSKTTSDPRHHNPRPNETDFAGAVGIQLALIVICSCSLGLILLIVPFDKVVRSDGTKGEPQFRSLHPPLESE